MKKFLIKLLGGNPEPKVVYKNNPAFVFKRRSGNSTRLIDKYVQDLFDNGVVQVLDHYDSHESHKRLLRIFLARLSVEHGCTMDDVVLKNQTVRFSEKHIKRNYLT